LVILAEEFNYRPYLTKLLKKKKGLKGIFNGLKKDKAIHLGKHRRSVSEFKSFILTDLSNVNQPVVLSKTSCQTPNHTMPFSTSFNSKPLSSYNPPSRDTTYLSLDDNLNNKHKTCTANFLDLNNNSLLSDPVEYIDNIENIYPSSESINGQELGVVDQIKDDKEITRVHHNTDGEILELEKQFSELCALYDNMFPINGKKKEASFVDSNPENTIKREREISQTIYHLNEELSTNETPFKLTTRSQPPPKIVDLLSDSDSQDITSDYNSNNTHVIERALETLPLLSISDSETANLSQFISKSLVSLPSTIKLQQNTPEVSNNCISVNESNRPWVIIRRYEMRGGKKIRLPYSLHELIQLSGDKLGIVPVCIREVSTEAEIEDISAIEPDSVLWVMTEEDEITFSITGQRL